MLRWLSAFMLKLATMAFLVSLSLFLGASFLMTWPLLRKSPRDAKIKATADLAAAMLVMAQTWQDRKQVEPPKDA